MVPLVFFRRRMPPSCLGSAANAESVENFQRSRQIAGAVARRIVMYAKPGDMAAQGSEFGVIKFGSRVDVFLPLDSKILVKEGDVVKGAKTVLAERS